MISTQQCLVISCDECGEGLCGDEYMSHFDTVEAAEECARDEFWMVTGGRATCASCTARQVCAVTGHTWGRTLDYCRQCGAGRPVESVAAL